MSRIHSERSHLRSAKEWTALRPRLAQRAPVLCGYEHRPTMGQSGGTASPCRYTWPRRCVVRTPSRPSRRTLEGESALAPAREDHPHRQPAQGYTGKSRSIRRTASGLSLTVEDHTLKVPRTVAHWPRIDNGIRRQSISDRTTVFLRDGFQLYHSSLQVLEAGMCPEVRGKGRAPSTPSSGYQIRWQPARVRERRSDVGSRRCVVVESGQRR